MDDLISRSALLKYLRDYKWEFAMGSDFSKAMEMIDAQPTAYNVEKVVAELESEVERWRESGEEYNDKHDIAVSEGFKRAVPIVRRGGVE